MRIDKNWLFNIFRNEAGADGDAGASAATTTVLTEDVATEETDADANANAEEPEIGNADDGANDDSSQTPEDYADFEYAEGVTVDESLLDEAKPLFKELGLTQEQAQKLVDFQAKQAVAQSEGQVDAFNRMVNDWQEQSKNDKEFGGDKFDENIATARVALDSFGTPELKTLMETHGLGNHPEVIRMLVKVGNMTKEDTPMSSVSPSKGRAGRAEILYPTE